MAKKNKCGKRIRLATMMLVGVFIPLMGSEAVACGLKGLATRTDGSKVDGTARISTSWNNAEAFPRDGRYTLKLGASACGETVEVFVNGYSIGRHKIPRNGNVTVDTILKGTSDMPVR